MANKFNFTTKIGLDSAGFKKGVNSVQNSLKGLKSTFLSLAGALGAGLGLGQFVSRLKDTATELSIAQNTLKNVSYQTKGLKNSTEDLNYEVSNYQDNLFFVKRLSRDYAQDLVSITDNYAKFISACKKTSLTLEEQRNVYESLVKAAAYFHLSADRTSDMMNAVVQMMSKGKVAAEELRRQLGNTLPGAFNLMAAAMGVSTAELDKLMRDGKVIAAEVLPKFAAMLNTVTATAEFDSLQAAMNNLKNAWYELVENSGAEGLFKTIINTSTKALGVVSSNMDGIKSSLVGLLAYFASVNLFSIFVKQGEVWKTSLEKDLRQAEARMRVFKSRMEELEKQSQITKTTNGVVSPLQGATIEKDSLNKMRSYNKAILQAAEASHKLGTISKAEFDKIQKEVNEAILAINKLKGVNTQAQASFTRTQTAVKGLGNVLNNTIEGFSNFLKSNWVFLLIGAVTTIWSYVSKIKNEIKRIANISKDYANNIEVVKNRTEEEHAKLRNNLKIVKDINAGESARILALKEINKAMGLVGDKAYDLDTLDKVKGKYDEITKAVERWIEATKKQAIFQSYASQIAEATAKKTDLERRKNEKVAEYNSAKAKAGKSGSFLVDAWDAAGLGRIGGPNLNQKEREIENLSNEIQEYTKVIQNAESEMKKYGVSLGDFYDILGESGKKSPLDDLKQLMADYNKDTKELGNQLRENAISQENFNSEFDKLVTKYYKSASSLGILSIEKITDKIDKGSALTALEEWYYNVSKAAAEAVSNSMVNGLSDIIMKDIDQEIAEAAAQAEKELQKEFDKEKKQLALNFSIAAGDFDAKEKKKRNPLMDYSKTSSNIFGEELGLTNEWADSVNDKISKIITKTEKMGEQTDIAKRKLKALREEYQLASKSAKTLESAMNYQKIVEDIKSLEKEIGNLAYSGVKDFATSIDRVVSAWDTLEKTIDDSDASGWEKFMAFFNLLTQIVDTATGIWQTITTIQSISNKLGMAKISSQTALNQLLTEELALRMAIRGATNEEIAARVAGMSSLFSEQGLLAGILGLKQQENAATATGIGLKNAEAVASSTAASASAGEALAGATASGAKMPFPLNLMAIAAGVAAVVGALSMLGKFAKGGIVGGNSTHGDRNLARVNSGEMILNKAQQSTLWGLLNGKGGIGNNVNFKIKGSDLIGVINNENSRRRG